MGLVNTVVPLEELEEETVRWCREMLELSPFALRLLKASFNAAEDGLAGIQQLAHDANLLFYMSEEAREGRDAYRDKRPPDFAQFPRAALTPLPPLAAGRRGRARCRRRSRPVLVGTALALTDDVFRPLAFVGGAGGERLHPDRHEPLERLLGRAAGRRHRGSARARCASRPAGCCRPRRVLVGTYLAFGIAVAAGAYLAAVAGWELLVVGVAVDPRRRALHRRAAPVRLRGARRGVRVPVLRRRGGGRARTTSRPRSSSGRRSRCRCRSGCSRRRSWW